MNVSLNGSCLGGCEFRCATFFSCPSTPLSPLRAVLCRTTCLLVLLLRELCRHKAGTSLYSQAPPLTLMFMNFEPRHQFLLRTWHNVCHEGSSMSDSERSTDDQNHMAAEKGMY